MGDSAELIMVLAHLELSHVSTESSEQSNVTEEELRRLASLGVAGGTCRPYRIQVAKKIETEERQLKVCAAKNRRKSSFRVAVRLEEQIAYTLRDESHEHQMILIITIIILRGVLLVFHGCG